MLLIFEFYRSFLSVAGQRAEGHHTAGEHPDTRGAGRQETALFRAFQRQQRGESGAHCGHLDFEYVYCFSSVFNDGLFLFNLSVV